MNLKEKTENCICSSPFASKGCSGGQQRGAWPVAHSEVEGPTEFEIDDGFGYDGSIEGVAGTKVGVREGVEGRRCSAGTEESYTNRERDFRCCVGR